MNRPYNREPNEKKGLKAMRAFSTSLIIFLFMVFFAGTLSAQWVQTNGPYGGYVEAFAVSPNGTGGANLFAGTWHNGVYLSTNNGTSWTAANAGLTSNYVSSFAVSPNGAGSTNLFAGTGSGVFLSTNNGTSWTAVDSGLTSKQVLDLAVIGTNLFAGTDSGVFLTTNNGTSWNRASTGLLNGFFCYIHALAVSGPNLFAATHGGVYLSTNNGTSWTAANAGLTPNYVSSFAVSPNGAGGTNLFAGTGRGAFLSTDNGTSWTAANVGQRADISLLTISGTNLFAGSFGDVFLSTDNGTSWTATSFALADIQLASLIVSGMHLFAGTDSGVFCSTDNGSNWNQTGLVGHQVTSLVVSDSLLFAGTGWVGPHHSSGGALFRSSSNGADWDSVSSGYVAGLGIGNSALGTSLFLVTFGGDEMGWVSTVERSTDNGVTWIRAGIGLPGWTDGVTCFASIDTMMLAGTWYSGIFLSSNNGISWMPANTGITDNSIGSSTVSGTNIFAGTAHGVFLTTNNGANWSDISGSLINSSVSALTVSDSSLFAGTTSGVWKRPLSEIVTSVRTPSPSIPARYAMMQNYPNPFNPTTTISYQLPAQSRVTLKIFDVLGREVATLVDGIQEPGYKTASFNAGKLASGVYYYRLHVRQTDGGSSTGSYVDTKKLLLLK